MDGGQTRRCTRKGAAVEIHKSAENYLETILLLEKRLASVRSVDVANELGFSKPSVSIAMKNLRENGHIVIDGKGGISLTETGRTVAEVIYERHRLLTDFFISLGVREETAAEDACSIEHIISPESFEAIKALYPNLPDIMNRI